MFVKKFLKFIEPLHVRISVDKVIAICSGIIQGDFDIPGFRCRSYNHADLCGVTFGRFCVGRPISLQRIEKL